MNGFLELSQIQQHGELVLVKIFCTINRTLTYHHVAAKIWLINACTYFVSSKKLYAYFVSGKKLCAYYMYALITRMQNPYTGTSAA